MVDKLPDFEIEKLIWKNYRFVCGCDEVGRGAFAGPVVAGAVVFEKYYNALDSNIVIKDSKELSPKNRKIASDWIKDNCLSWAVGAAVVAAGGKPLQLRSLPPL